MKRTESVNADVVPESAVDGAGHPFAPAVGTGNARTILRSHYRKMALWTKRLPLIACALALAELDRALDLHFLHVKFLQPLIGRLALLQISLCPLFLSMQSAYLKLKLGCLALACRQLVESKVESIPDDVRKGEFFEGFTSDTNQRHALSANRTAAAWPAWILLGRLSKGEA